MKRGLIAAGCLGLISAVGWVALIGKQALELSETAVEITFWVASVCGIGAFSVASITFGYNHYC